MLSTKQEFREKIEEALAVLRKGILMHGGNVEVVDADPSTGIVTVRLQGACIGCPLSDLTLKMGIEETLKEMVPGVKEVRGLEA